MKALLLSILTVTTLASTAEDRVVDLVDPFLGTAPITNPESIGYQPPWRVWAGLTFPGASLPNAMVQLSPITEFGSGAGYEYEDTTIRAFTHTNKGHWNLCHLPILPVTGDVDANDFASPFSHETESASPGYYQVLLERYGIRAELTTTLRVGCHRYTFPEGATKKLILDLGVSNENVRRWNFNQSGANAFEGYQQARETVHFHGEANHEIASVRTLAAQRRRLKIIEFAPSDQPLEIAIGLSFVSARNARLNLEGELKGKSFDDVRREASGTWEQLLAKAQISGGTEKQRGLFYSCLYRSFLWPALRSDLNGEFPRGRREVGRKSTRHYTTPALWDDYRNKLVLLGLLAPDVTNDVIQSLIDRGEQSGFMPTFFHGDHAAPFIAGSYQRGLRGYDFEAAYRLLLKNATVENRRARPYLSEYLSKGYISTPRIESPGVESDAKAGVTKTLEYSYDDYAVALLAEALGDRQNHSQLMKRAQNYRNLYDPTTGFMRGRLENGDWVTPFDPTQPYYEYMYREANGWQSSFFAPHDTEGLIALHKGKDRFEDQLDSLFSIPWNPRHIARNISCFIGQYCHGNQPDHGYPWLYHFVGQPGKSQAIIDRIMDEFYGMEGGKALCGMDDAGEMSAWYVFAAMGFYPYSPADPEYLVTVPLFDTVRLQLAPGSALRIRRSGASRQPEAFLYDGKRLEGFTVSHSDLLRGKELLIRTK